MAIILRVPKRQVRIVLAGFVVVALGAGVAAQTSAPAAPVPARQIFGGAALPHDISVGIGIGIDLDRGPPTLAQHPEEELLGAPEPTPSAPQADRGQTQQTEPPQAPQSTVAASGQESLTPEQLEALTLIDQMIRDREGVLMGIGFDYNAGGRRDPFMSLVPNASQVAATSRPFGLPGFAIDELELKAVASAQGRWHAMVVGPNRRAYFLVVGTELFDGHVMEISSGEVIFEQVVEASIVTGARRTRPVTKRLRTTVGGGESP